jgi:hypothetical protein
VRVERLGLLVAAALLAAGLMGWWLWWPSVQPSGFDAPASPVVAGPDAPAPDPAPQAPPIEPASAPASASPPTCPAAVRAWAGQSAAALESMFTAADVQLHAKVVGLLSASNNDFERALGVLLGQGRPPTADKWPPLIQAAAVTDEPRLVALGAQACGSGLAGPAGCPPGLIQRWAELEPDNLQAWLAVADEASGRQDEAAAQAALARAADAGDSRTSWGQAQAVLAHPGLRDAEPLEMLSVAVDMINIESMASLSGGGMALRLCSEAAGQAGDRMVVCSAIAGVLVERGRTLMDRGMGIALARRSGWAASRIEKLEAEQRQLQAALAGVVPRKLPGDAPLTEAQACGLHRQVEALLAIVRSADEVQAARRLLAQGGSASGAVR